MLAWLAAGLCGCASAPPRARPVQYLDWNTGTTFVVAARPMVFAHDRPQAAARVRDYATVLAGYMDRGGRTTDVLLVYLWSTIDPRDEPRAAGAPPELLLTADDRQIPLRPLAAGAQGVPPLGRPPVRHWVAGLYGTDLATLRYLVGVRYLSLSLNAGADAVRYGLWADERASLAALARSAQ